ncbi:tRNA lysidine(34) synthetase TilS [Clostridium sp. DJ247]|uniref:tRNA lysidine(34) synthetase TilS n=1 Tax=Clostridium sp. DJ247 TaxID=2726188 RepID=UPI001623AE74|nr:tRNA lysidine(34) synthetase TilS [Clostridium sp. DJ247]MBC2582590.1 tRNA lysidine(34) synthetase TilS [Clostridium sp. DJ247]
MIENVLSTIKKHKMFDEGDKILVAVSGGPDSVALLNILYRVKDDLNITIYAAHVNHGLRGKESDEDEEYVRNFCSELNIEFMSKRVDIDKISKVKNISCESAGREARYEFFEELKRKLGLQKIAIAHNLNDQAETVLMRIMRGTGVEGLVGIKPVRDKIFVRPLINSTRDEIEAYCRENNLYPRIDKTNLEPIYSRNKIRLQLIPYIKENFNKDIVQGLNRLADSARVDNEYLDMISKEKYKKYCDISTEKIIISKEAFLENEAIITRMLRLALYNFLGYLYNFEKVHIYDIIRIQSHATGKKINLPNNICVINNYGHIYILKNKKENIKSSQREYKLHIGRNQLDDIKLKVNIKLVNKQEIANINKQDLVKYFDYDKIKENIILRYRKDGDRFMPSGMKGHKKLKDFFIDLKIPKERRENIPLICFGNEIGWIIGYRVSEIFKIDKYTQNILQISVESEEL